MKYGLGFWIAVIGLIGLHFLLHLSFSMGREAPDFLTVALLLGARAGSVARGAALGWALGLLEDAFSVLAFGTNALALAVVGALGSTTRDFFVGESVLFISVYLFVGKWLRDLIQWSVMGEGLREPFVSAMLVDSALGALYVAVVGIGVVVLLSGGFREARA